MRDVDAEAFDVYVQRGKRQVESAEWHVANGRIDYAAGALIKAQRNFDRAVKALGHPFVRSMMNQLAERLAADMEYIVLHGDGKQPGILSGWPKITKIGFGARILQPSARRVG